MEQAERVAAADTTVLIQGETGTGKELIAHTIHNASSRSGQPLIKLNHAAILFDLLESELFGHQRGAFTGAIAQKMGITLRSGLCTFPPIRPCHSAGAAIVGRAARPAESRPEDPEGGMVLSGTRRRRLHGLYRHGNIPVRGDENE